MGEHDNGIDTRLFVKTILAIAIVTVVGLSYEQWQPATALFAGKTTVAQSHPAGGGKAPASSGCIKRIRNPATGLWFDEMHVVFSDDIQRECGCIQYELTYSDWLQVHTERPCKERPGLVAVGRLKDTTRDWLQPKDQCALELDRDNGRPNGFEFQVPFEGHYNSIHVFYRPKE